MKMLVIRSDVSKLGLQEIVLWLCNSLDVNGLDWQKASFYDTVC